MVNKIELEAAELELARVVEAFEVDPESAEWGDSKGKLLAAIQHGRIVLNEEKPAIVLHLAKPIEKESGGTIAELEFSEPTASDLKVLDKYKAGEGMAKTIHLASKMTGQPVGVIERMGARDLSVMGAIAALFF